MSAEQNDLNNGAEVSRNSWRMPDGRAIALLTPQELERVLPGDTLYCIDGEQVLVGTKKLDDDTRFGYTAYGRLSKGSAAESVHPETLPVITPAHLDALRSILGFCVLMPRGTPLTKLTAETLPEVATVLRAISSEGSHVLANRETEVVVSRAVLREFAAHLRQQRKLDKAKQIAANESEIPALVTGEVSEMVAEAIYNAMRDHDPEGKHHPWTLNGNSLKQDEARARAKPVSAALLAHIASIEAGLLGFVDMVKATPLDGLK